MTTESQDNIELVEVIAALRANIEAAIEEGEGEKVKFALNEVEIQLQTVIGRKDTDTTKGEVTVGIPIFQAGGSSDSQQEINKQNSHTITLKMQPKLKDKETGEDGEIDMSASSRQMSN